MHFLSHSVLKHNPGPFYSLGNVKVQFRNWNSLAYSHWFLGHDYLGKSDEYVSNADL